ncbi:MAG: hypothetical protein ABR913_03825 [Sedimentisphaerales bacterium]|jgi:hypothetical protein
MPLGSGELTCPELVEGVEPLRAKGEDHSVQCAVFDYILASEYGIVEGFDSIT